MWQRIQTIYLLVVVILGITLCFEPILSFDTLTEDGVQRIWHLTPTGFTEITETGLEPVSMSGIWALCIVTVLIPLLALVDIFLYKKRILQARLNIFLAVLCLGYYGIMGIYVWHCKANLHFDPLNWHMTASMMIPVICFVLTLMATRRILKDEALVRAADRIRR